MMQSQWMIGAGVCALVCGLGRPAAADAKRESQRMSLAEALSLAAERNPDLSIADSDVVASAHRARSTRKLRWPSVHLSSNVLLWDEPIEIAFADPGGDPAMAGTLTVREQVTSTTRVTAVEPLSSQLVIDKYVSIDEIGLEVSRLDRQAAELDVQLQVGAAYLSALLAESARAIAEANIGEFEAQLDRGKALQQAGVIERVDVMRLEAGLAEAKRRRLEADNRRATALDQLRFAIGLSDSQAVDAVDDFAKQPGPPPLDEDQAVERALAKRPELAGASKRVEQAALGAGVARAHLFPNVSAVATYEHNEGSSTFQAKDSWFVGVTLEWDVWDWGRNWYSYKEAGARAKSASLAADRMRDGLVLQVRSAARDAGAAHEALGVAKTGLDAAEEAYRIAHARFDEGAMTTTELLAAQSDATRARLAFATARYSYVLSIVALARAVAESPDALLSEI